MIAQPKQVSDDECDFCKQVVTFTKTCVDSNATEAEAKQVVEAVCKHLPSSFKDEVRSHQ